jgi:hypothetical protein
MKLSRLFMIALLVGTMGVIGCGDSGSGGESASQVCADCANDVVRAACVEEYNQCIAANPNDAECPLGAQALCGL